MSRGDGGGLGGRGHGRGSRTGRVRHNKSTKDNRSRQLNPKDPAYWQSRSGNKGGNNRESSSESSGANSSSDWKEWMTQEAVRRIQSHADRTGRNQEFKSRAQAAVDKNEEA